MGNQRLLCPHLYRDLAPSQHPRSSYCTWRADRVTCLQTTRLRWTIFPKCWVFNVKMSNILHLPWEFMSASSLLFIFLHMQTQKMHKNCTRSLLMWQNKCMVFFIVGGDFNQTDIRTVLPKFHQQVHITTRGRNTLDYVWTFLAPTKPFPRTIFDVLLLITFIW